MTNRWVNGLLLLAPLLFSGAAMAEKPHAPESIPGAKLVSAEDVVDLIQLTSELVVIDARKEAEYAKGHIQGAISMLDATMTPEQLARHVASPSTAILFYCNGARCLRSTHAVGKALAWGYKQVYWFRGGWQEWLEKDLPISR